MNKALERIAALAKRLSSAELQILMQLAADEAVPCSLVLYGR